MVIGQVHPILFCDACGTEHRQGIQFCIACGVSLKKAIRKAERHLLLQMPGARKGDFRRRWRSVSALASSGYDRTQS